MCEHLAERKTGLMLVEFSLEHTRHDVGNRKRLRSACFGYHGAALLVVFHQVTNAFVQPVERQSMTRQYQNVMCDGITQT